MNLEHISGTGLVRFNAINQKALTIIQSTVFEIAKKGVEINIDNIPLDDKGAYALLSAGMLSNIKILDSKHYKAALTAIQPYQFEHLCAAIALCHFPLSRGTIPHYAERKQIPEMINDTYPALESITAETYGLIIYQEQVMYIAQKIAGFSLAQGDLFRRALKNSRQEVISTHKTDFINGAIKFGLPLQEATNLFEHVAKYNRRTFNKSHAVAFAMTAYQTAWLKANYSQEFTNVRASLAAD